MSKLLISRQLANILAEHPMITEKDIEEGFEIYDFDSGLPESVYAQDLAEVVNDGVRDGHNNGVGDNF